MIARATGRVLAGTAWGVLGLAGLLLGTALVLAVRLGTGPPMVVTGLARRAVATVAPDGERIGFARATLGWDGFRRGLAAPIMLGVEDLSVAGAASPLSGRVGALAVSVATGGLIEGVVRPVSIAARDGALRVALPAGTAGGRRGDGVAGLSRVLDALRTVSLERIRVDVAAGNGRPAGALTIGRARFRRGARDGIDGAASLTVASAGAVVTAALRARPSGAGGSAFALDIAPFVPADALALLPALASVRLPVGVSLEASVDRARRLGPVAARVTLGAGTVAAGGTTIAIAGGDAQLAWRGADGPAAGLAGAFDRGTLSITAAALRLGDATGPLVRLGGALTATDGAGGRVTGQLLASLDRLPAADLGRYWPPAVAHDARRWITTNIPVGQIEHAAFAFGLASHDGWGGLDLASVSGGFDGRDLDIHWLRPIAPITGADGHVALVDLDTVAITLADGHQGGLSVAGSRMRITGLTAKAQIGTISIAARGPLQDALAVLSEKRLHLLSRQPLSFTDPSGAVALALTVTLPLDARVTMDQIGIVADATLARVHLGDVAAGRSLDDGALALHADPDGLQVTGTAAVARIPVRLGLKMDFRAGPPSEVTEAATVSARADAGSLAGAGLPVDAFAGGSAAIALDYALHRDGAAVLALSADLRDASFSTPVGWHKAADTPGSLRAEIGLRDGRLVAIDALSADAPGLRIRSHAIVSDGRVQAIALDRLVVGRTSATGRVTLPQGVGPRRGGLQGGGPRGAAQGGATRPATPVGLVLAGPTLDLSTLGQVLAGKAPPGKTPPGETPPGSAPPGQATPDPAGARAPGEAAAPGRSPRQGQAWTLALDFGQVLLPGGGRLDHLDARVAGRGERPTAGHATASGPSPMSVSLRPDAGGRVFAFRGGDAGALFGDLGITDEIGGGTLALDGRFADGSPRLDFAGHAVMTGFTLKRVPWAARLLRDVTVYGLLDRAPTPSLSVTRLDAPVRLDGDVLRLTDARVWQPALGLTASGTIGLASGRLDLTGTVVPAYAVNTLPGRIPVIGKLLSPEKGGGLFAATWSVRGPADKPSVAVNPLAALVPGVLRKLLPP